VTDDLLALEVLDYWSARAKVTVRSKKVRDRYLVRIRRRLAEAFGPDDLKKCVDFAMNDDFYAEKGYFRQPDVIWRDAERVASILARWKNPRPVPL
jgi:hypothetical protein